MTVGIGHNSGRVRAAGHGWRRHAWQKARKDLLPRLPIEVIRLRVRRAAELGLPYKTYAGVRASTGHDLVGFLFSSNALHVVKPGQRVPNVRARILTSLNNCDRIGLMQRGISLPDAPLDAEFPAPAIWASWSDMRDHLKAVLRQHGRPADRFLLVGDTTTERSWAEAAQTAGYMTAQDYFGQSLR